MTILNLYKMLNTFKPYDVDTRYLNTDLGASLKQVLEAAGLDKAYLAFTSYSMQAQTFYSQNNPRAASDVLYKVWMSPDIIPALLLFECFYARDLIFPSWDKPNPYNLQILQKKGGGTRKIIVPDKSTRICMGVVNSLLQSGCQSWSNRSTGFRPGYGTQTAINLLKQTAVENLQQHSEICVVSFDISKAFNTVDLNNLFRTLNLQTLPHPIKHLIWKWHHTQINTSFLNLDKLEGLPQGFSYCPTLFSWYLDNIFIKNTTWIGYADNFTGVFKDTDQAFAQLKFAQALLYAAGGFKLNKDSVYFVSCNKDSNPIDFKWLGHSLVLPSCNVDYNKHVQDKPIKTPQVLPLEYWTKKLKETNWVNLVKNMNWRSL